MCLIAANLCTTQPAKVSSPVPSCINLQPIIFLIRKISNSANNGNLHRKTFASFQRRLAYRLTDALLHLLRQNFDRYYLPSASVAIIGWIPAAIWAVISLKEARANRRTKKYLGYSTKPLVVIFSLSLQYPDGVNIMGCYPYKMIGYPNCAASG